MRAFCTVINGKLASLFDTKIIVFYTHTIMFFVSLCFCYQFIKPSIYIVLLLSFLGFIYLIEYVLIYLAHKYCTVLTLQPCEFSKMLYSIILSATILNEMPTINSQPRQKGKWIDRSYDIDGVWNYCSVCMEQAIDLYDFCPNCGADMREDT